MLFLFLFFILVYIWKICRNFGWLKPCTWDDRVPNQHRVQETDHRHDGVIEELVKASDTSHLAPQLEHLPVWWTSRMME